MKLLGRGEVALCQVAAVALLAELLPSPAVVFAESIRRWHDGTAVTAEERDAVVAMLEETLRSLGASDVVIVPARQRSGTPAGHSAPLAPVRP